MSDRITIDVNEYIDLLKKKEMLSRLMRAGVGYSHYHSDALASKFSQSYIEKCKDIENKVRTSVKKIEGIYYELKIM